MILSFLVILKYTTKLLIFLAVNQPTIAKLDIFSLLQIIERIPDLRFKYMGSYPSDTVPQLTKLTNIEKIPELRFKYMGSYPSDTVP